MTPSPPSARLARAVAAGLLLLAAGCGGGRKEVVPARGRVLTAAGKPAAGASVVFHPVAGGERNNPAAVANDQGEFVLTTYADGDGAPPGEYRVTVEWRPIGKSPADDPADRLKGKFRDAASTPFRVTVSKDAPDLPPIRLP